MSQDVDALLQSYPVRESADRAALLDFARSAQPTYGVWKSFKKLYKLVEAEVYRAESQPDLPLMAVLLSRVDALSLDSAGRSAKLKVSTETTFPGDSKTLSSNGVTLEIGGRTRWDYSGFRVVLRTDANTPGNFLDRIRTALQNTATKAPQAATPPSTLAFDVDARAYFGYNPNFKFSNGVLEVKGEGYYRSAKLTVDLSDPVFPHIVGAGPSLETRQYMKRRARRLLRTLSKTQSERYFALLSELFRVQGDTLIAPALNWALMDTLYASSPRFSQPRAGRGPYVRDPKSFVWKRREERAPELWNAHLDFAGAVAASPDVPAEASQTAVKVLSANRALPQFSDAQLLHFLRATANVPVLHALATRGLVSKFEALNGDDAARVLILSGGRVRREVGARLPALLEARDNTWRDAFAGVLAERTRDAQLNARGRVAARTLFSHFRERLPADALWSRLALWLSLGDSAREWALQAVREAGRIGEFSRLPALTAMPEPLRELAVAAFMDGVRGYEVVLKRALLLVQGENVTVNSAPDVEVLRLGWRVLAAAETSPETLLGVWEALAKMTEYRYPTPQIWAAAFSSSDAAQLLASTALESAPETSRGNIQKWLRAGLRFMSLPMFEAALRKFEPESQPAFAFDALLSLPEGIRGVALEQVLPLARDYRPDTAVLGAHLRANYNQTPESLAFAWQFAAASQVTPEVLREAWPQIGTAYFGVAAAILLRRAAFSSSQLSEWFNANASSWAGFSAEYFSTAFEIASGDLKIALVLAATPQQWDAARAQLVENLSDAGMRSAFWRALWPKLGDELDADVRARLIDDAQIGGTFTQLDNDAFADLLRTASDNHLPFIARWLDAHESSFERGDVALIAVATHPVGAVRARGLGRVRELGLNVPLALRLLESGVPEPFEMARDWFNAQPEEDAFDLSLALCDSPEKRVRDEGLSFIEARRERLVTPQTLQRLMEHFDANVQSWVANEIVELNAARADEIASSDANGETQTRAQLATRDFDAAVLRGRGRARRAKESIKRRLNAATPSVNTVDERALIEIARGFTARDREWALVQLARLSVSGASVEDVTVRVLDESAE